jgi:ferredoxin--NADP+ reductase
VDELLETDIADYALEALSQSRIKEVHVLGRRGPAQAAFTNPEIKEMGELEDADLVIYPQEAQLDEMSLEWLEKNQDRTVMKKVEMLQGFAGQPPSGKPRKLVLRFLVSPTELIGDDEGKVASMELVHNVLYATEAGTLRPRHTERTEKLPVDLVFRSIGYRGVPLPEVPFYDNWGVILNQKGRVLDPDTEQPLPGLYTAGWIKRGPTGVIGTNKPDAGETVGCMLDDLAAGQLLDPAFPDPASALDMVGQRQADYFTYQDWQHIDQLEVARGEAQGRPRIKFTTIEELLAARERQRN